MTGPTRWSTAGNGLFRRPLPLGLGIAPPLPAARHPAAQRAAPEVGAADASTSSTATPGPHTISATGLQMIMEFEGFSATLYDDVAGHCTIGFGHLVHKGRCNGRDPAEQPFRAGIQRSAAEALLRRDVQRFEQLVNRAVAVPLTQAQFDALVDFAYNLGFKTFRSSTMLVKLNAGDYAAVPGQLRRFVKAGGAVQRGLVRRREREAEMFASGLAGDPDSGDRR